MALMLNKVVYSGLVIEGLTRRSISHSLDVNPRQYKSLLSTMAGFSSSCKTPAISSPPQSLLQPINVPRKLLMGPGPSNCSPRVLAAGALPMIGHMHPEFIKIMEEVREGIKYAFQTQNEWTFALSGTGHAAMEAAVVNLLEPGDVALVCQNGIWGERLADMIERNDAIAKKIIRPMGEVFSLEEIEQGLKTHKPCLVFVTYGESSAGTKHPLEGLGDLCHKYNAILLVDSVAILGGAPMFMDAWNIDVLYSGAQKVLSVPPAVSPMSFSMRAREKITNRKKRVRSYYFDAQDLANYWGCDKEPFRYHHTAMVTSVYMLREGLAMLAEEGLEKSWQNHKNCSELLYEGLEKLGLELLVKDKNIRNPCVTLVKVPQGINWKDVSEYAMKNYQLEISGGLGDLAGKVWRIGIMGYNCTPENIRLVLRVMGEALDHLRK